MSDIDIKHIGVVKSVDGKNLQVLIETSSLCSKCHAKGACSVFDKKEKIIDVIDSDRKYSLGDEVTVALKRSFGIKAVIICYIIPLIIMVGTLITAISFKLGDGVAGILSLISLVPYYYLLYLIKDKFLKEYKFRIS